MEFSSVDEKRSEKKFKQAMQVGLSGILEKTQQY
jgi:hypothetical protein